MFFFGSVSVPRTAEPRRLDGTALAGFGELAELSTGHGRRHGSGRNADGPSASALSAALLVSGEFLVRFSVCNGIVSLQLRQRLRRRKEI